MIFTPRLRPHQAQEQLLQRVQCARTLQRLGVAPGARRMCLPAGVTIVKEINRSKWNLGDLQL
jgi:hypothetical protein